MRRAAVVTGAVLAAAVLVTGCTSSSGSKGAVSSASRMALPSLTQAVPSDAQLWDDSVCSTLDPAKVAEAISTRRVTKLSPAPAHKEVLSRIGAPTFDYCRVELSRRSTSFTVYYGVSATTWSARDWRAYVNAATAGTHQGRDYLNGEVHPVDGHDVLAETGAAYPSRGMTRVGDRLVAVYSGTAGGVTSAEQYTALLRLVLPLAKQLHPMPSTVADPACAAADQQAAAALGSAPIVRRSNRDGGVLGCGWATRDKFVRVRAWPDANSIDTVRNRARAWSSARVVEGVGAAAIYLDSTERTPPDLQVATREHFVDVAGQGDRIGRASLVAVAEPLIRYY